MIRNDVIFFKQGAGYAVNRRRGALAPASTANGRMAPAACRGRGCPVDTSQPQAEKRRPSRQARLVVYRRLLYLKKNIEKDVSGCSL